MGLSRRSKSYSRKASRRTKRGKSRIMRRRKQRGGGSVEITYTFGKLMSTLISNSPTLITVSPTNESEFTLTTVGTTQITNIQMQVLNNTGVWVDIKDTTAQKLAAPFYTFTGQATHIHFFDKAVGGKNVLLPSAKAGVLGKQLVSATQPGLSFPSGLRIYNLNTANIGTNLSANTTNIKFVITTAP